MTGNASRDDNYLSFAAANSEARSGYLADRAANEIPFGGFTITDQATGFVRKEKTVEGEPEDVWGGNYAQAWDLVNIYSRYRDLSDAPLIMEVSASCLVTLNFKGSRDEEFSTPLNFYGPYDTSFPQIDPGDSNIEANSDSLLAEPVQVAFGTKRVWSGNNGAPMPTPSLAGAGPAGEYYNESQQFAVTLDQNMSTNINHPDLEFFIP